MRKVYIVTIIFCMLAFSLAYANVPKYRSFVFDYNFTLKDIPRNSSYVKVWVPYPAETSCQSVEEINPQINNLFSVRYDRKYKNKILCYFVESPEDSSIRFNIRYKVRRKEYSHTSQEDSIKEDAYISSGLEKYLKANRLVTMSPRVKQLAATITQTKDMIIMDKAKAIYDYVFENMSYDKTLPGWGVGDTERACDVRAGNCTDFHSLFISLCRASGIPAKFLMGVKLPKENKGQTQSYHCWAEFYAEGSGWVPVDISEAWKDRSKKEYYFGRLCKDRIEFTHGRDIILEPNQKGGPLNYLIYPYVEIDGKRFDNVEVLFEFRNI